MNGTPRYIWVNGTRYKVMMTIETKRKKTWFLIINEDAKYQRPDVISTDVEWIESNPVNDKVVANFLKARNERRKSVDSIFDKFISTEKKFDAYVEAQMRARKKKQK